MCFFLNFACLLAYVHVEFVIPILPIHLSLYIWWEKFNRKYDDRVSLRRIKKDNWHQPLHHSRLILLLIFFLFLPSENWTSVRLANTFLMKLWKWAKDCINRAVRKSLPVKKVWGKNEKFNYRICTFAKARNSLEWQRKWIYFKYCLIADKLSVTCCLLQ